MRKVLNVGSNRDTLETIPLFNGWMHHRLDIDPEVEPDIVCDARSLTSLEPAQYDAVYCSHNLEHYFEHDLPAVLSGFKHILKNDGFAVVIVPDMTEVFRAVSERGLDIEDELYRNEFVSVRVKDVIWGYGPEIARRGEGFFAHKNGFTEKSLLKVLTDNGFAYVFGNRGNLDILAVGFVSEPTDEHKQLFNLEY